MSLFKTLKTKKVKNKQDQKMAEINARKQIIDKIDAAENILVTVSSSPSVDELAAALGLAVAINKSGKRATAVASGEMPDALQFLRPEKTFEDTVDSLRDFIIALSKDKADHLRYKIVGDHVKIFITPYRTVVSEKDLEFEQGDFNVDLVLALGVRNKNNLDSALAAHGRILHDASVGVITVGSQNSSLSELNWHSPNASSLSEVVLDIVNSLNKEAFTKTVATALLTGIVAETERFSNDKTSARVMNVASKLMTAGADQQLVVSKLKAAAEKASEIKIKKQDDDEVVVVAPQMPKQPEVEKVVKPANDGSLSISHDNSSEDDNEIIDDFQEEEINQPVDEPMEETVESEAEAEQVSEAEEIQDATEIAQISMTEEDQLEQALGELAPTPTEDASSQDLQVEIVAPEEPVLTESETLQELEYAQIVPPVENYQPEIPFETILPTEESAFVAEEPVLAQNYQPAEYTVPQISAHEQMPVFEDSVTELAPPTEDTSYIRAQSAIGANEPAISGDLNALTETAVLATEMEKHDGENRTTLSHGVPGAQTPVVNFQTVLPQVQEVAQPQFAPVEMQTYTDQPAEPVYVQPAVEAQPVEQPPQYQAPAVNGINGFPLPPPIPDFSAMPLPPEMPPLPNFDIQDFNTQNISGQAAQGSNASTASVIPDAVYPADPSKFKIPGM